MAFSSGEHYLQLIVLLSYAVLAMICLCMTSMLLVNNLFSQFYCSLLLPELEEIIISYPVLVFMVLRLSRTLG